MTHFTNLRVFNQARMNIQNVAAICRNSKDLGNLHHQLQRSAVSVASNIAEGSCAGSLKQNRRFYRIARASNHELHAQLLILSDINPQLELQNLIENINYVGKMLSTLIRKTV